MADVNTTATVGAEVSGENNATENLNGSGKNAVCKQRLEADS